MPNPSRALPRKPYRCVTAGVALAGAGIIAVTPVTAPLPEVHVPDIQLTAGEEDIVIDFVRHAATNPPDNVVAVASQGLPGFPLSTTGEGQAVDVGTQLAKEFGIPGGFPPGCMGAACIFPDGEVAGIFGGYEQRMSETAAPFLTDEGFTTTPVSGYGVISPGYTPFNGFDEIGGGIYAQAAPGTLGDYLYQLTVLAWVLGLRFVPLPGSNDYNGMYFEENFGGSNPVNGVDTANGVDTVYNQVVDGPASATGNVTAVVFSGEAAISTWTLMNVNNPDIAILLPLFIESFFSSSQPFLPNVGQVVIEGNPTDGWTLESFNGTQMPADPGLLTQLIVDTRNLITPPQMAAYNIFEAALTGNLTTIETQLATGIQSIGAGIVQFPESVFSDTVYAVQNLVTEVAAGASLSDAFGSLFLGLP